MDKLLLDIPEAAEKIGVGRTKFYELISDSSASPAIPTVRIGRRVLIPAAALQAFVDRKLKEAAGETDA